MSTNDDDSAFIPDDSVFIQGKLINTILTDVTALTLTYRDLALAYFYITEGLGNLLIIKDAPPEIIDCAIERADKSGKLIDLLSELLFCKLSFSSDFLGISCAPVDLLRDLAQCKYYNENQSAEQILQMELIRRAMQKKHKFSRPANDNQRQTTPNNESTSKNKK